MHVEYVHVYISTSITGRKIGQGACGNLAKNIGMSFRKNKQVIEEMSLHIYSISTPPKQIKHIISSKDRDQTYLFCFVWWLAH